MSSTAIINGIEYVSLEAAREWADEARAAERAACANLCRDRATDWDADPPDGMEGIYEARRDEALGCADAIRNRTARKAGQ